VLALMGKKLAILLITLGIAVAGLTAFAAVRSGDSVAIDSFEFLGCSGDWTDEDYSPEIWRMGSNVGTTYLVRHPGTCGANTGRNAKASLSSGSLNLQYELYNPDEVYAMCSCEFWAKFTFRSESSPVTSATFDARAARLKGSWPER